MKSLHISKIEFSQWPQSIKPRAKRAVGIFSLTKMPSNATTNRARGWCFTLNNPPPEMISERRVVVPGHVSGLDAAIPTEPNLPEHRHCDYRVGQLERGDNGTLHIQGYYHHRVMKSFNQMKKLIPNAHWEIAKGSPKQNRDYCTKEDTRVPDTRPFEEGECPHQGTRFDLRQCADVLANGGSLLDLPGEMVIRYHRGFSAYRSLFHKRRQEAPTVLWIYGPTGSGKSRFASTLRDECYWKPPGKWFDGYDQEPLVILDDYRSEWAEWGVFGQLLRLLDRYPLMVEYKGGSVQFCSELIVITCDRPPSELWFSQGDIGQLTRRISHVIHAVGMWLPVEPAVHESIKRRDNIE
ncbi:putative viral replication protein [Acartia tonsa copepod circovirus]|uniref:putative viral replication protein n=1 Tax=Acartia tonsa copepod circovirus TaxID=1168547 RepID=UPI0002AA4D69|nr:putative viral replication protein [Acartia tonsa copepod circovirus]AFN42891.1 putative viral replication protein [Acartia tonsa copepod circovirus]